LRWSDSKIFSNSFANTGKSEIGLSSSNDLGGEVLGIGMTYAILNDSGNVSC